eukprot:gb/GEZN01004392.1/.p1 GENE.gb/GEZN01004392.1/~~gb/GEZN01004392.1/.p1  ORF type:complete len:555 (-),score=75.29 gb/GEZN01004392.1/:266-1930(-)
MFCCLPALNYIALKPRVHCFSTQSGIGRCQTQMDSSVRASRSSLSLPMGRRNSRRGSIPTASIGLLVDGQKNLIHEAMLETETLARAVGATLMDQSEKAKQRPERKELKLQPVEQRTLGVKGVIIAGACGFIGRMMLFKILTHTPDNCKVYALARGDAEKRVRVMMDTDPGLALLPPEKKAKVIPVSWDMIPEDLGIAEEMLGTLHTANIMINCAGIAEINLPQATVDAINVDATVRVRKVFSKMGMFVQFSSAFVNSFLGRTGSEIQEKQYYTFNTNGDRFPNSFSYSKAKMEETLSELQSKKGLGLLLFIRPSLVTYAYRDPFPGWGVSHEGVNALAYLLGLGIIRQLRTKNQGKMKIDVIPVDAVANMAFQMILNVAIQAGDVARLQKTNPDDTKSFGLHPFITHCCTSTTNPITLVEFVENACATFKKHPLAQTRLPPSCAMIDGEKRFAVNHFFKYSLKAGVTQNLEAKKLQKLDAEVHHIFGFFFTSEQLFRTSFAKLTTKWKWDETYFEPYLMNLGDVLTDRYVTKREETIGEEGAKIFKAAMAIKE